MNISNNQRIAFLYSSTFIVVSLFTVYLPVWLYQVKDLDLKNIGYIIGSVGIFKIFSNILITNNLINIKAKKNAITLIGLLILFIFFIINFIPSLDIYLSTFLIFACLIFFSPVLPLVENISLSVNNNFQKSYGKLRVSGSVSFLFTVFLAGYFIDNKTVSILPFLIIISLILWIY